jgi:hypothetical protein
MCNAAVEAYKEKTRLQLDEANDLKHYFLGLSYRLDMSDNVRNDILDNSYHESDVVAYWKDQIAQCKRMIRRLEVNPSNF